MSSQTPESEEAQSTADEADTVSPAAAENTGREVARRVFAEEFNAATHSFTESDEERAPNYVLLPTGAKANRVFVVGTITDIQDVGTDAEYWQARIVGATGTFFAYAGQYQPEAAASLRSLEPPAYVAIVGKARTYETDEGDTHVSLQPETVTEVDGDVRNRWIVETAERTIERLEAFDTDENQYAALAAETYVVDREALASMVQEAIGAVEDIDVGFESGQDEDDGG